MQQQQQHQQIRSEDFMVICPSFSSYATNGLVATAAKVADEFRCFKSFDEDDDEFEFSVVLSDEDYNDHDVAEEADEVICAGQIQIRPFINHYPMSSTPDRALMKIDHQEREIRGDDDHSLSSSTIIGIPLRDLFLLDQEDQRISSTTTSFSSSSSCDSSSIILDEEMETNTSACFWRRTPKSGSESSSPNRWKKSSSTGSGTKRMWRLRDLLRRSNSDGKLTNPKHRLEGKVERSTKIANNHSADHRIKGRNSVDSIIGASSPSRLQSLHEAFYGRSDNKAAQKEGAGCRRKSYLPYRPNLVGIFGSVRGMGTSYPF